MESVKDWVNQRAYDDGFCCGEGIGRGRGSGFGSGIGRGYGSGCGSGCGEIYAKGDGSGFRDSTGCGYGYGTGYVFEEGNCYVKGRTIGIKINGREVLDIDSTPTIIYRCKGNLAHGAIVKEDLTLTPCYIVRGEGRYAHGETLSEARASLSGKIILIKPESERIADFIKHFPKGKPQKGTEYYEWHHILTGSCKMGRDAFVKANGIDLTKDYTPEEFISLTKNSYGGKIIKALSRKYERSKQ